MVAESLSPHGNHWSRKSFIARVPARVREESVVVTHARRTLMQTFVALRKKKHSHSHFPSHSRSQFQCRFYFQPYFFCFGSWFRNLFGEKTMELQFSLFGPVSNSIVSAAESITPRSENIAGLRKPKFRNKSESVCSDDFKISDSCRSWRHRLQIFYTFFHPELIYSLTRIFLSPLTPMKSSSFGLHSNKHSTFNSIISFFSQGFEPTSFLFATFCQRLIQTSILEELLVESKHQGSLHYL